MNVGSFPIDVESAWRSAYVWAVAGGEIALSRGLLPAAICSRRVFPSLQGLLFSSFASIRQAALIILNVPLALIGGIVALFVTGQYLSVPASVGFIALFGVAVLNGVVLVSHINQLRRQGLNQHEAVVQGTLRRLRPVLMTALSTALGLIPLLLATGSGSEIQRPLATVVVGGLITSTLLTLVVIPVLYPTFEPPSSRLPSLPVNSSVSGTS